MKHLYYLTVLSAVLAGCADMQAAPADDDNEPKVEVTGSMIPRKRPREVEIIGRDGFNKAMGDAVTNGGGTMR